MISPYFTTMEPDSVPSSKTAFRFWENAFSLRLTHKPEAKGVSPGADEALALPSKYEGAFRALQASAPHQGECGVYPSGQ